ncbi:MAG: OB-fold nucleic acid binding domain-containing protein, partial [Treponema sp.]|nr:OB-fold nucleic acid binding domain-containing protein [Treponema sp.]
MVVRFLNSIYFPPVQCAAFGAAFGFYLFSKTHITVAAAFVFIFLAAFSFLRVLSSLNEESRKFKLLSGCSAAVAAGLVLGICAAAAGQNNVRFGIPENKITAVEAVLLEDPRIVSSGSAMVSVSLRKCADERMRISSSGEITIFFPQENAEKLKQFGRGTVVFAEGSMRSGDRGYSFSAKSLHIVKPASSLERKRTGIRLNLINRFNAE